MSSSTVIFIGRRDFHLSLGMLFWNASTSRDTKILLLGETEAIRVEMLRS